MGIAPLSRDMLQNAVSHPCAKMSTERRISHCLEGGATLPENLLCNRACSNAIAIAPDGATKHTNFYLGFSSGPIPALLGLFDWPDLLQKRRTPEPVGA